MMERVIARSRGRLASGNVIEVNSIKSISGWRGDTGMSLNDLLIYSLTRVHANPRRAHLSRLGGCTLADTIECCIRGRTFPIISTRGIRSRGGSFLPPFIRRIHAGVSGVHHAANVPFSSALGSLVVLIGPSPHRCPQSRLKGVSQST